VSLELDAHRRFVADRPRVSALAGAIAAAVRPGDVVIDLASGTGILGLLACRAGAARVYCIESGSIISLARDVARSNGFEDRMQFVFAHSSHAHLPERADVLLSDQIGQFGFEAGLIGAVADVRTRLLKPGARVVPGRVTMYLAPVETAELRGDLGLLGRRPGGLPLRACSGHRRQQRAPDPSRAGPVAGRHGVSGAAFDLHTVVDAPFTCEAVVTASRDGVLDGIGGWFVADLEARDHDDQRSRRSNRIDRRNVVFPIDPPARLHAGDAVTVSMRIRPSDLLVRWTVEMPDGQRRSHSTLAGMFIPREDLERTHPAFMPRLTARGLARRTLLELCDGRPLHEIEREVYERHRDLFDSETAAHVFVAEVVTLLHVSERGAAIAGRRW
jgi:protein arginine N-methyltransferase 1